MDIIIIIIISSTCNLFSSWYYWKNRSFCIKQQWITHSPLWSQLLISRAQLVEHGLITLPRPTEFTPVFCGDHFVKFLVFCVVFLDYCMSFFFWPLHCLPFLDLWLLVPLFGILDLWLLVPLFDILDLWFLVTPFWYLRFMASGYPFLVS